MFAGWVSPSSRGLWGGVARWRCWQSKPNPGTAADVVGVAVHGAAMEWGATDFINPLQLAEGKTIQQVRPPLVPHRLIASCIMHHIMRSIPHAWCGMRDTDHHRHDGGRRRLLVRGHGKHTGDLNPNVAPVAGKLTWVSQAFSRGALGPLGGC
jgi:hypothetical protein